ncbi:hypothetical protein HCH54_007935 [Aspergillus fumigatus]
MQNDCEPHFLGNRSVELPESMHMAYTGGARRSAKEEEEEIEKWWNAGPLFDPGLMDKRQEREPKQKKIPQQHPIPYCSAWITPNKIFMIFTPLRSCGFDPHIY